MKFVVTKIVKHVGNSSEYYTIKSIYSGIKLNITYDLIKKTVTVHEWYKLSDAQLAEVESLIKTYITNNSEQ